jgi:hypothetical protein
LGVTLIAANAPDHFLEDTPIAVLIDQVLAAVAPFRQAGRVAKLKGARHRNKPKTGKCGGRYSMLERDPYVVREAKRLAEEKRRNLPKSCEQSPDAVCDTGGAADAGGHVAGCRTRGCGPRGATQEGRLDGQAARPSPWARKRSALACMAIERQERVTPCFGRWN